MTEKGYNFLTDTHERFGDLYGLVVVGADAALARDFEKEIIEFCEQRAIPWVRRQAFDKITTEYAIAVSWRWMIPHPSNRLIVFHDSLLPRYRGFSPLVNALINGEKEIGVSAVFGAGEFDTGDIIAQASSTIDYPIKIKQAIAINNANYAKVASLVYGIRRGAELAAVPQNEADASYSVWRDELDYVIDWSWSAKEIRRLIDSVGRPYAGAATKLDGAVVRIHEASEAEDVKIENRHVGKVLFVDAGKPIVVCGQGMLKIVEAVIETGSGSTSLFPPRKFRIRFTN